VVVWVLEVSSFKSSVSVRRLFGKGVVDRGVVGDDYVMVGVGPLPSTIKEMGRERGHVFG
jgi:hypothetical protein